MSQGIEQVTVVSMPEARDSQANTQAAFFKPNGQPLVLGTSEKPQIAALAAVSAPAVNPAAGANPTQAEYATMVTLVNELRTRVIALTNALKA